MEYEHQKCGGKPDPQVCEEQNLSVNALARLSVVPPSTLKNINNGGSKNPGIVTSN